MTRIVPLEPPYRQEVAGQLKQMSPAGAEPIALFRTLVKNLPMAQAMHSWGSYELSRRLTLTLREREIIIDRTCARAGCEYEWGVHVAVFAGRAGLTHEQVASLTHGYAADECWADHRDRLLITTADVLHDTADVPDELWEELSRHFDERQLLDILLLTGWYHAISYAARAARVPLEPGAPTFASVRSVRDTA
jgi:alkylhydroperoxidase family enzyme